MTEIEMKLESLQLELEDSFGGDFAVLRGDDSLCLRHEDWGPVTYITLEQDEDGDDAALITFSDTIPANIAAAVALVIDDVLQVFVDCDTLFHATKVGLNERQ